MDEAVTKRIHISGLTPAITAEDLSQRFSSFGTVKAIDGYGLLDAVGQPRKYAYITLETTKSKLARCMNLLSGVTWKGAKLRLGEAKPDYRERIQKEHEELKRAAEASADEPPKKRRRLPHGVQGVQARDMSLVTPENVSTRGGWRVTPAGRLIRPMRMRPAHPLPEPLDAVKLSKEKSKSGKIKTRPRDPPTRARRKTIDPTKWGSQHLKGIFLENAAVTFPAATRREAEPVLVDEEESESSESDSELESSDEEGDAERSPTPPPPAPATVQKARAIPAAPPTTASLSAVDRELAEEKSQSLGLLQSLFGDKDEWSVAGSVDSDLEEEIERERHNAPVTADADDVEDTMDVDEQQPEPELSLTPAPHETATAPEGTKAKLKDLFAPREEDAGFSLLGHLDLDLELDDDVPFDVPMPTPAAPAPSRAAAPVQLRVPHTSLLSLDSSRPLFFPTDQAGAKRRVLDPTNWRTWFYRTDTPDAIRARWEETKGELTAGWKRRHREAIKSRRRRGGGAD
ncbi:hypothetical protein L226DRAFT_505576 [Lentinus tigrinus ALCF2SS1-7]|uniref:RRM domain-containing protein n=1 Tax=Lentinus tigrinus ALCF2SS1-6 TaxID=1328759 RepID=A0A5C2SJT0_9APHY|nr:hypothetical protein L227DRAFT_541796 [Lentinus tigrinus ALCF2SS1-6]RPD76275.1 hypothetical protein L226DRAFT_505576 [Lentinus tigrinus ALCF2SS1-7]